MKIHVSDKKMIVKYYGKNALSLELKFENADLIKACK